MKIILGSKSPRRRELLSMLGYEFLVEVSDIDEHVSETDPQKNALAIARKKAQAIKQKYPNDLIICADTIVVCDGTIIGKPKDIDDARRIITKIQDNKHIVYTAVVCSYSDKKVEFVEGTKVYITKMTSEEIEEYINTSEPYDKSGGYAIQGIFGKYIEKIDGDFYNVVGLPICKLNRIIEKIIKNSNH